ncbi:MAG: DUF3843 family protein, partial [Bacteroidales bacterium]|nr:DUF3843 family protein [Bacteroidales bacterium]
EGSKAVIPEEVKKENADNYEQFRQAAGDKLLLYFEKGADVQTFLTETTHIIAPEEFKMPREFAGHHLAVYATPQEGVQVIFNDVECIKDENNPYYDAEVATKQALSFFIVKHCSVYLLAEMMQRGMLADAQAKSLVSDERSKAIIQENWPFLVRYFIREYTK